MTVRALIFLICLVCAAPVQAASQSCTEEIERGVASWYGPGFEGALTSSEEVFDPNLLSAAHPDVPLGTFVRVVNMRNQKDAVVKINDRGNFGHSRAIDVSESAARMLGMIEDGTAAVAIFKCNP